MKNRTHAALALVAVLFAVVLPAMAEDTEGPLCPVMGEAVDFSQSFVMDDAQVFVCCKKCINKIKENPGKYAEDIAAQHKALEGMDKVQVACPISGKPVDPEAFALVGGKKVYTCCPKCIDKYKAGPDKFKAELAGSYTYQTKCPISGEDIDPTTFATMPSGFKVYTCCEKCVKKFQEDPEKYWSGLEKQGFNASLKAALKAT